MKKILILSLLMLVAVAEVSAQRNNRKNRDISVEDVEYKSVVLNHPEVREIAMFCPVDLTIVDGEEGYVEISYPVVEEEYIRYSIYENEKFGVGRNGDMKTPKNSILSDEIPIRVTVSLPQLRRIFCNDCAMVDIIIEHDSFAQTLQIDNGMAMWIKASSITAAESIEIRNAGTLTLEVDNWNTKSFSVSNIGGSVYLRGSTNAESVRYSTVKQDNVELNVACKNLFIFSRSKGILHFNGTADEVNVSTQRGSRAMISYPIAE